MIRDFSDFEKSLSELKPSDSLPVMFLGHGNPMNAITENKFRREWQELGKALPKPAAILCISAHWLTKGTYVTAAAHPETIHDFRGFPPELYQQHYPAPGAPEFAKLTIDTVQMTEVKPDTEWGLDHGAWCILESLYPEAKVPVYQMSIDYNRPPEYHTKLARELSSLRRKGVLIIGSGNIVHNLRLLMPELGAAPDWAVEFDQFATNHLLNRELEPLIEYEKLGSIARLAVPTNDHYLPMLYCAALRDEKDELSFFAEDFDLGSISMRSFLLG